MTPQIPTSSQPTITEAFAKKRNPTEPQTTDTHKPPQPAEPVIEVTSSAPATPAPVPEPELVPDDVIEEEPRPTTTKVTGTKQLDGCESQMFTPSVRSCELAFVSQAHESVPSI